MSDLVPDLLPGPVLDDTSAEWVAGLTERGHGDVAPGGLPHRDAYIKRLHVLLLKIARAEASRRAGLNGIAGKELDDLACQAADDALMSILRKIGNFRGESKFTSWAYKFVVFEVATKFGRHAWRRDGVRLDPESWDRLPAALGAGPEAVAESRELVTAVREAVKEAMTPHQQQVFVAIVVNATPLDALVAELGSTRNAIYKTMFDARRKLRAHLIARGHIRAEEGKS